jgi:hypothetical protein
MTSASSPASRHDRRPETATPIGGASGGTSHSLAVPGPAHFAAASDAVREEDVAKQIPCGPDVEASVAAVKKFVDAGFTHVALVQIGGQYQEQFFGWAEKELLPALRQLG